MSNKIRNIQIFISGTFVVILFMLGVFNIYLHTNNLVSNDENRILAKMPQFNEIYYMDASYMKGIDDFLRDQFFLRKYCIQFSKKVETLKGIGYATTVGKQNIGGNGSAVKVNYYYVDEFCFYNFTRKKELELFYANAIEKFATEHTDINIYNLIVPNSVAYVSDELKKLSDDPFESMDFFDLIYKNVKFIDVRDEFEKYKIKELFFKTDHHWNGDGSYAAYKVFCELAGISPIKKENMQKLEYDNMLGSLYNMTKNEKMRDSPDRLIAYNPIYPVTMIRYYIGESGEDIVLEPAPFCVSEMLMGDKPSYGIYLGGDMPRCIIQRNLNDLSQDVDGIGKNVVLVKDSFGNAFSTLLTQNYDEVHVIDPRSWNGNIYQYAKSVRADDIVFLNTTSTVSSENFVNNIVNILGSKSVFISN